MHISQHLTGTDPTLDYMNWRCAAVGYLEESLLNITPDKKMFPPKVRKSLMPEAASWTDMSLHGHECMFMAPRCCNVHGEADRQDFILVSV